MIDLFFKPNHVQRLREMVLRPSKLRGWGIPSHSANASRTIRTTTTTRTQTTTTETPISSDDGERTKPSTPRKKELAEVIRGGFLRLNQAALDIQNNPLTRKSIFAPPDPEPSPRQKAEEHMIRTTATEYLEKVAKKDGKLCVHGDPIVILDVEVKKGSRLAVLHWCLPFAILADETVSMRDKQLLEFRMHQILTEGGGTQLIQRGVHAALRHYYPPRLRLDPAPDELLLKAMRDIMD